MIHLFSIETAREKMSIAGFSRSMIFVFRISLFAICFLPLALPSEAAQVRQKQIVYACPMHKEVKSNRPGKCPKCQMTLRVVDNSLAPAQPETGKSDNKDDKDDSIKRLQIPDTPVYDQNGQKLRFYTDLVRGKTVAINFIFTTCTTICPPLTATFRRVQKDLGERVGRDVALISVSVDPLTDVPERLKAFSAKFQAGPGWTFVTGSKPEIDGLLRALGVFVGNKNDHTPTVLIGNDRAGVWTRAYGLAPPSALVKAVTDAAGKSAPESAGASPARQVQADAPAATGAATSQVKTPAEAAASYFTNTVLVTQDNQQVRFYEDLLKGKTVLINFLFTTCTGVCPPMTANLQKVQQQLGDRVGRDINMISFTVDPATDTPEVMKKYATTFKAGPGWYFLSGAKQNLDIVLRKLGGFVEDKNDHTTVLIIGNVETGEWLKVFAMAKPAEIADAVLKIAGEK